MPLDSSTSITLSGVTCWDEGTVENFGRLKSTATRIILCNWSDRLALIAGLRGGGLVPASAYPDAPWLVVESIEVEGVAGPSGLGVSSHGLVAYAWARLKVHYNIPEYSTEETGSLSLDFSTEVISAPGARPSYQYSSDSKPAPPEDCPALRETTVTFVRTIRNLTTLPVATILSLAGKVNSSSFEGAAAGTVKFEGAFSQRRLTGAGAENWDVTYKFIYRPNGWNKFFRASSGHFEAVVSIGSGQPPYASGDFSSLIT